MNYRKMQIVDKSTIQKLIDNADPAVLLSYIEDAFTYYSSGRAVVPPVGTLSFEKPPGDVHIKYGYVKDESHYVIKIASGFYQNPEIGLSSSNGLNLVFSQKTGVLEAVLLDEGFLTDLRTALAGAVVAKHFAPGQVERIGIVGTGIQARLQLEHLKVVTDCRKAKVWGRNPVRASEYAKEMNGIGFEVDVASEASEISRSCNLIVTTTPSEAPLLPYVQRADDVLITAMGADTKGKGELDPDYLRNAACILMDSESQCMAHGEIHKSVIAGEIPDSVTMLEVGTCLLDKGFEKPSGLIVADLTGIATQDIQISRYILDNL